MYEAVFVYIVLFYLSFTTPFSVLETMLRKKVLLTAVKCIQKQQAQTLPWRTSM